MHLKVTINHFLQNHSEQRFSVIYENCYPKKSVNGKNKNKMLEVKCSVTKSIVLSIFVFWVSSRLDRPIIFNTQVRIYNIFKVIFKVRKRSIFIENVIKSERDIFSPIFDYMFYIYMILFILTVIFDVFACVLF